MQRGFIRAEVIGYSDFVACGSEAAAKEKGMRVIAQGQLKQRSYETKEGEKRTVIELEIDEIGPSLRFATASVVKATGNRNQAQNRQQATRGAQQGAVGASDDGWSTPGSFSDDTPPTIIQATVKAMF